MTHPPHHFNPTEDPPPHGPDTAESTQVNGTGIDVSPLHNMQYRTSSPAQKEGFGASPYQRRVFGADLEEWDRIAGACFDARTSQCLSIAEKLAHCCENPMVYASDDGKHVRMAERRCRSRCCPRCAKFRANELTSKLIGICRRMDSRRMVTLTMRSVDEPLRDQLCELRRSFGRLRRSRQWKDLVTGGVYTVEVTMNRETGLWHPHLHAIIDGSYFPCMDLKAAWEKASKGSTIAHIRAVPSATQAARYVSSYVAKSSDARSFTDAVVAEWAEQVHGLRLASTFGNLHGVKIEEEDDNRVKCRKELQPVNALVESSLGGDVVADSIIVKLQADARGKPVEENEVLASRLRLWIMAHEHEERQGDQPEADPPAPPPPEKELFPCPPQFRI